RTRARVIVALLEGPPSTGQIMCYKNRTDDVLSTGKMDKVASFNFLREDGDRKEIYIIVSSCLNAASQ
ncbi:MAG: hypothetical protein SGJ26_05820, partial [Nitrospirota bacterium]|nr:hypothetical protein [Nitrospirota bacterium]